jgi:magnesium chelatase family protein
MGPNELKKYCKLTPSVQSLLREIVDKFHLSARSYDKLLKLARTIADLGESELIREEDILEAIQYRVLDRKYWEKRFS